MAANYQDVQHQLRAAGLCGRRVEALEVTGRVVRTQVEGDREQRGWYLLHAIAGLQGGELIIGSYGIWRGTDNGAQKIQLDKSQFLTEEQLAAIKAKWREDRKRADAQRKSEATRAARRAELMWRRCSEQPPAADIGYLTAKGIAGHGVRYTPTGAIVVPMSDATGRVYGLQFILSRANPEHQARIKKTERDKEYWPQGLQKQGRWHQIGAVAGLVLVCEGYATGASLHEATGLPVAVAFDAGNLVHVARSLQKVHPRARLLLCADDDFASRGNPGLSTASAAALAVNGAWVAPVFHVDDQIEARRRVAAEVDWSATTAREVAREILRATGRKLTDFNDLHQAEGLLTVRAQIEARLAELGWRQAESSRAGTTAGGEGCAARAVDDWRFDIQVLVTDYALIYGTDTVFDRRRQMILGLGPLRSAAGKSLVREWLEHPDRVTVMTDQVGFDPGNEDPRLVCNLWSGWPTTPQRGACDQLLELLEYLCSGETNSREVYDWVLRWLAYPIQHPGAKMQSALLMHGPEGTGKNTFFGAIRRIYGRYGTQFSQVELEEKFNGWASGKLFAIGNEVVSRAELYHIQGRLKTMVTEPEWQINEKMLPARLEANHCNFVFFSNRVDIAKLDDQDRRYCVIWTPPALATDVYRDVADEIDRGGVAALHDYLLSLDLTGFGPHTRPPMTSAKQDLIDLGMDSTERFWRVWTSGDIDPAAVCACLSSDLYELYQIWCRREGIQRAAQRQTLLTVLGKKPGARKVDERYRYRSGLQKRGVVVIPPGKDPAPGQSRQDWLGEQIDLFKTVLNDYRQGNLQAVA